MTSEKARQYFKDCKLSYDDIDSGDICILIMMLNKTLKKLRKSTEISLRMSEKIKSKYKTNGDLITCFLRVNGSYFTNRECISFNAEGFIGFCGWADSTNQKPIVDSFIQWCDYLKKGE
jgi:hypothetical protein